MEIKQYVNLPKTKVYEAASGVELNQLGERRLTVVVSHKVAVTVAALEPLDDYPYGKDEQARNPRFAVPKAAWIPGYAHGMELSIETTALPAAGGQRYRLKAKYAGEEKVSDDTLITWRMVFASTYVMNGIQGDKHSGPMARVSDALRGSFVQLQHDGQFESVANLKSIYGPTCVQTASALLLSVKSKLAGVRDHLVRILWANYLPTEGEVEGEVELVAQAPSTKAGCQIDMAARRIVLTIAKSIFTELEDTEQPFVRKATIVLDSGFFAPNYHMEIEHQHIAAVGVTARDRRKVELTLEDPRYNALFDHLAGEKDKTYESATLRYKFRTVEGFSGGFSASGRGLIVIATHSHWTPRDAASTMILLHEIGHFLGMVANGNKLSPAKPSHYYTKQGHNGPHCSNGVDYQKSPDGQPTWTGTPLCVMFGSTSAVDKQNKYTPSPTSFCNECSPVVTKLDLAAEALKRVHES